MIPKLVCYVEAFLIIRSSVKLTVVTCSSAVWLGQKAKGGMGRPDWNVSKVDIRIRLRKLLWVYCPGHARVKGNDRADRLASKVNLTGGLRLGRSEVVRSLRH